jgi:GAF domain-containing protein
MENARLLTEQQEALEQQTATAEVLGVINASPGNLAPVFEAILSKAHALCGAALGSLASYDGEVFSRLATHGYPPEYETLVRPPNKPLPHLQRLLDGARFVHDADLAVPLPWNTDDPYRRAAVEIVGIRTALFVPLRKDGRLLGYISAQRREVRPFSEKEIALLENFAAQAVIAMENARLLTEQQEALEQQTATAEVLQVINASPGNLTPVFDAMLEKAMRLCEAQFGVLSTYDGERFRRVASHGMPVAETQGWPEGIVPDPGSALERVANGERVVHILDLVDTDAYRQGVASRLSLVATTGALSALWVGLRKDDALLGVFVIYRREVRAFSDKQIALVRNFADQAVIAIENTRLLTEQQEALEQQPRPPRCSR